ncbi:serine/threonine protein kinase, partial [Streptomyces sp. SID2955]|nr:serine/threonine protein kinase [Streptomyces sp. SID2955]
PAALRAPARRPLAGPPHAAETATDRLPRRRTARTVLAACGVLAAALTGYLLLAPGHGDATARVDSAPAARWSSLPAGWQPWQTTAYADAER